MPQNFWAVILALMLNAVTASAQQQYVRPITRFHTDNTPYMRYNDNLLSGFLQTAVANSSNGFLQMPILGRPLWMYIGEKDSTQYMAYASGFKKMDSEGASECSLWLNRYDVTARLETRRGCVVHHYQFPDTTAEKGFVVDIDNSLSGAPNEDMNFSLVDRYTIRAYKRSYTSGSAEPELYYYARFSHPYESYNVRRERVTLENGRKESRLKAAFTFLLNPNEELVVTSAVSPLSTDDAFARVEGKHPARHLSDARKPRPADDDNHMLAQNNNASAKSSSQVVASAKAAKKSAEAINRRQQASGATKLQRQTSAKNIPLETIADKMVVETREPALRTGFYAALDYLLEQPFAKKITSVPDFITALRDHALPTDTLQTVEQTDSILRRFSADIMTGSALPNAERTARAASFVLSAIGLQPTEAMVDGATSKAYRLHRPMFNVVTLYLPSDRRFILHTKTNTPQNCHIHCATWNGEKKALPMVLTEKQIFRGGILAVKMASN